MKKTQQKVNSASNNQHNSKVSLVKPELIVNNLFTPAGPVTTRQAATLPEKTPLYHKLVELVRVSDPFSLGVDVFTALANRYYYAEKGHIGTEAQHDFITAPELGSLFARSLALWATDHYLEYSSAHSEAEELILIELGPGNGTLLCDFIESLQQFNEMRAKPLKVICLENSELLRSKQEKKLIEVAKKLKLSINFTFITEIEQIALEIAGDDKHKNKQKKYLFLLANEFFDAIPSKQFAIYPDNPKFAHEITLGVHKDELIFTHSPQVSHAITINHSPNKISQGEILFTPLDKTNSSSQGSTRQKSPISSTPRIIEHSPVTTHIIEDICKLFQHYPGAAAIIDYGYSISPGKSTLQAIKGHVNCGSVLPYIGQADISHLVNFGEIQSVMQKFAIKNQFSSQKSFLMRNCVDLIYQKAYEQLSKQVPLSSEQLSRLELQYNKLTSAQYMGELFKCLEFTSEGN